MHRAQKRIYSSKIKRVRAVSKYQPTLVCLQKNTLMVKKITLLTALLLQGLYGFGQEIKFGVHVDPFFSFLASDYSNVEGDGFNFGVGLGVEAEYQFNAEGNYALTFGADFSFNNGGTLLYKYGGNILPNTDFDNRSDFRNVNGDVPASSQGIPLVAYTRINYRANYVEIPVGLKLRTNELGDSYMRAFFHIPIVKIMVPVSAGARIFSPDASAAGFLDDNDSTRYGIPQTTGSVTERNVWNDITPIQVSLGLGAGVELTPNQDGGLRIYAGVYYHSGLIDITGGFGDQTRFFSPQNPNTPIDEFQDRNPRNGMHNIALRLGVIF